MEKSFKNPKKYPKSNKVTKIQKCTQNLKKEQIEIEKQKKTSKFLIKTSKIIKITTNLWTSKKSTKKNKKNISGIQKVQYQQSKSNKNVLKY